MLHSVGLINASIRAKGKRVSEEVLGMGSIIIGNVFYLIMLDRSSGEFLSPSKPPRKRAVIRVDVRVIKWNKYQKKAVSLRAITFSYKDLSNSMSEEKCETFSSFVSDLGYGLFFFFLLR